MFDNGLSVSIDEIEEVEVEIKPFVVMNRTNDEYMGDYDVTPKFSEQKLPTARKTLTKDLTILGIPYAEVTNNAGGKTVVIG